MTKFRKSVSSFGTPMPYGSSVNGLPTSSKAPSDSLMSPTRITLSVLTASTRPLRRSSAHFEYTSYSVTSASGAIERMFSTDVEPCTEHTRLPARSSTPAIESSSAATMMS